MKFCGLCGHLVKHMETKHGMDNVFLSLQKEETYLCFFYTASVLNCRFMSNKRDLKKKKSLFIMLSTLCSEMCSRFQLSVFACLLLSAVNDNRNYSA